MSLALTALACDPVQSSEPAAGATRQALTIVYQDQRVNAASPSGEGAFGHVLAASGDTFVAGSNNEPRVFQRSSGTFIPTQDLSPNQDYELYGGLALEADLLAGGEYFGSIAILSRSAGSFAYQATIPSPGMSSFSGFGEAISLSGTTLAAGARYEGASGTVHVYLQTGSNWSLQQTIVPADGIQGEDFGASVAVSGDTVLIGAPGAGPTGSLSGSAYVYVRSGTTWSFQQKLTASDGAAFDDFGVAVALDGAAAVVGAPRAGSGGAAYVYTRTGTTWTEQKLVPGDAGSTDSFGDSVALSGGTLLVGAPVNYSSALGAGAGYRYLQQGGVWVPDKLVPKDAVQDEGAGSAVALGDSFAVLGAPGATVAGTSIAGAVYVYKASLGGSCGIATGCASGFCVDGVCCDTACGGGASNDCVACSTATGAKKNGECGAVLAGSSCDDGDACTQVDTCQAGSCFGASRVVCGAAGSCSKASTCDSQTGMCVGGTPEPDGTPCSDGNGCTQVDSCKAGTCVGTNPTQCTVMDECHQIGTCNPQTGACSNPSAPDGTTCSTGTCSSGACSGGGSGGTAGAGASGGGGGSGGSGGSAGMAGGSSGAAGMSGAPGASGSSGGSPAAGSGSGSDEDSSCGCRVANASRPSPAWAALALLWALRRRRGGLRRR